jgi:oligoendopeptidase F
MLVFERFWDIFQNYKQTLAITLQGQVKNDVAMAKIKGYDSSLDQALAEENIPIKVYETLVSSVNEGLPSLHRLIKLRQRILGLKTSEYYDIYPSVVSIDKKYSLADAKQLTLEALKPLGKGYINTLSNSLDKNWMHVYPAPGKRSGAYVMGAAYDVHPYVLLNFDNTLESVSTFMHEWGHAMHTLLANDAQPFEKADYSTFIAEIASTANEILLFDHLRKNSNNDQEKLYFLFKELSQIRGTFFRQTQFAEFELAIHQLVEKGEALSADKLDRIYGEILKRYYGHNEGVMNIKDKYTVEWAYIPHFYRNFYVYQYATSISAAYFLTDKILNKEKGSKETLINILKAGGSNYPFDILLNAGVDMSSEAVYTSIISRMDQLMDEVELILNK